MIAATKVFRIAPNRNRRWAYAAVFLAVAPLILLAIVTYQFGVLKDRHLLPLFVIAPIAAAIAFWADARMRKTARLVVDAAGLRLESGQARYLGRAGWSCRWEEIAKVTVLERMGLVQIRRHGFTAQPVNLRVADWMEEGAAPPEKPPALRESPLYRVLEEAGLFRSFLPDANLDAMNFDLAQHPTTRAAMAVMAALAAYWATDSLLAHEAWAEWSPRYIVPHAVIGVVAAIIGGLVLERAKQPRPIPLNIVLPVALLVGLTAALASWTGLIRVNQFAGGPLEEKAYVRNDACDTLLPVERGLPPIEYTDQAKAYWCQFPKSYRHVVPVRKGLAGLYQVDLTRHTAAIREFRARQGM